MILSLSVPNLVVDDSVGIAATGIQERRLRGPRSRLGQLDQFVLDLEGAQSFEFTQRKDVSHGELLYGHGVAME